MTVGVDDICPLSTSITEDGGVDRCLEKLGKNGLIQKVNEYLNSQLDRVHENKSGKYMNVHLFASYCINEMY